MKKYGRWTSKFEWWCDCLVFPIMTATDKKCKFCGALKPIRAEKRRRKSK